jgi:hypothetical protein
MKHTLMIGALGFAGDTKSRCLDDAKAKFGK